LTQKGSSPSTSEYEKGEGDPQKCGVLKDYPLEGQSEGEELRIQFWDFAFL
jgi:hypothetical protein